MQELFKLLLDLLRHDDDIDEIKEKEKLIAVANKIENRWERNLEIAHKYWFIFQAYDDLVNKKISIEEFISTWDITSSHKIAPKETSSIDTLNTIIDWSNNNKDSLFILDAISFDILAEHDKKNIQNRAKEHNSELIFC